MQAKTKAKNINGEHCGLWLTEAAAQALKLQDRIQQMRVPGTTADGRFAIGAQAPPPS